jgi:hypothetical protein
MGNRIRRYQHVDIKLRVEFDFETVKAMVDIALPATPLGSFLAILARHEDVSE